MSADDRIAATERALFAWCMRNSVPVSADGRVAEITAASMIGLSVSHLRRLRGEGDAPAAYRAPVGGSRMSYRLADLAHWLEERRDECGAY